MAENNFCIIMAGGIGSRFWPQSRTSNPKQFLDILGTGKSFIRSTFERFLPLIPIENFFVVTSDIYRELCLEHLPELSADQILCEPVRRNTAPCIEYACHRIHKIDQRANVVVTPADHLITGEAEFQTTIRECLDFVTDSLNLLTIGIKPSRPETGYGYIQVESQDLSINRVKTFTEKPNLELAKAFVESGDFFWNSGIFIWSTRGILSALGRYLPELNQQFSAGWKYYGTPSEQEFINEVYPNCANISIDYGVMEKADNVYVRCGNFGWSDIGTWGSLYQHASKDDAQNAITHGRALAIESQNSVISVPEGKVAVVEGLDGYLVVDRGNTLLVCKLEHEQCIRNWVEDVKYRFGEEYI